MPLPPPDTPAAPVATPPSCRERARARDGSKTGSRARKVAANQANARRSTGPKSARGKSIARLNGLKHGLRAELPVLPGEDPEAFQQRLDTWIVEQDARTDLERHLVELAVRASWR